MKNKLDKYLKAQGGGITQMDSLLTANKDKLFIDRMINSNKYPVRNNLDKSHSTHKLAWGESDNGYVVYPTINYKDNNLFEDPKGKYAFDNNDFIEFKDQKLAERFANGEWKNSSLLKNKNTFKKQTGGIAKDALGRIYNPTRDPNIYNREDGKKMSYNKDVKKFIPVRQENTDYPNIMNNLQDFVPKEKRKLIDKYTTRDDLSESGAALNLSAKVQNPDLLYGLDIIGGSPNIKLTKRSRAFNDGNLRLPEKLESNWSKTYLQELAHSYQEKSGNNNYLGKPKQFDNSKYTSQKKADLDYEKTYDQKGSVEYQAHNEIDNDFSNIVYINKNKDKNVKEYYNKIRDTRRKDITKEVLPITDEELELPLNLNVDMFPNDELRNKSNYIKASRKIGENYKWYNRPYNTMHPLTKKVKLSDLKPLDMKKNQEKWYEKELFQKGGIAKDNTNVSKKYINPIDKQRINNDFLKSKVDANKSYLNPQSNVSQRVKDIALQEQANERINSRQDKANLLGLALAPVPIAGEIYNGGNMIAQGAVDALQGEYGNVLTSAVPYGVSKLAKYMKPAKFADNYVTQEQAVIARGERMLSQKSKFRDQPEEINEYFRTAKDRHNSASDHPAEKLGVNKGTSTEISKDANLSEFNKARVASHEVGHYYRNGADEANEWGNLVTLDQSKTGRYLRGKPIRVQNESGEIKSLSSGTYDETRERAGQLKDYIAKKNGIPLNQDFNITEKQFNNSLKNYVNDTGLDNNMTPFIKSINDKKGFLEMMNKSALGTTVAIIANKEMNKQQGGQGNLINAERGEVYRDQFGNIKKVSDDAPTHDDGILIHDDQMNTPKKASYNNGGVVLNDAHSVLSATHENRDSDDKSYGLIDEMIKLKPKELDGYAKQLGLKLKNKKSVSPSKGFELLRDAKIKHADKLLNKNIKNDYGDMFSKNSTKLNMIQGNALIEDTDLYDMMFDIQEAKKLNTKRYGNLLI